MSPSQHTARRMGLLWGVHAVHSRDVSSFEEMVEKGKRMALRHQLAKGGDRVIVDGRNAVRHGRLDQRAARRPADRRRARAPPGEQGLSAEVAPGSRRRSRARGSRSGRLSSQARAPASPCSHTAHSKALSGLGAARQEAADDAGEHIAAARHAEARRAAVIGPEVAARGDDMAGDAFDQHDRPIEVGGAAAAADRLALDPRPRRSRAATPARRRGEAGWARRECLRSGKGSSTSKHRRVERKSRVRARAERRRCACNSRLA